MTSVTTESQPRRRGRPPKSSAVTPKKTKPSETQKKNKADLTASISGRVRELLKFATAAHGGIGTLADQTGIVRATWLTFLKRPDATPSGTMIEALAQLFPEYAFWLASGYCDSVHGHCAPPDVKAVEIQRKQQVVLTIAK